jgi:hypothetical protein
VHYTTWTSASLLVGTVLQKGAVQGRKGWHKWQIHSFYRGTAQEGSIFTWCAGEDRGERGAGGANNANEPDAKYFNKMRARAQKIATLCDGVINLFVHCVASY